MTTVVTHRESQTVVTRRYNIEGADPLPVDYSRAGAMLRPTFLVVVFQDGTFQSATVSGRKLRKDGSEGEAYGKWTHSRWNSRSESVPAWLVPLIESVEAHPREVRYPPTGAEPTGADQ